MKKYETPEFHSITMESGALVCTSGNAAGDRYSDGSDFGGKDKWEGMQW